MSGFVPPDGGRSLFVACAIACCLAASAALFARAAATAAQAQAFETMSAMVVRVLAPEDPAAVERVAEALRKAPGVRAADPVSPARAAQLVSDWGGGTLNPEDLPRLRLIELEAAVAAAVDPLFAANLEATLAKVGYEIDVRAAGPARDAAIDEAARVARLSDWSALGAGLCAALIVAMIARARAYARKPAIAILAELGALRGQAAQPYAEEAAGSAFAAGVAGAAAAAAAAALILPAAAPGLMLADVFAFAGPLELAPLAATPLLAAVAAAVGARSGAGAAYDEAAKLR